MHARREGPLLAPSVLLATEARRSMYLKGCSPLHSMSWRGMTRIFRKRCARLIRLCTTSTRANTKCHAGDRWYAFPRGAEKVAVPMWQVAQFSESVPDVDALVAWKQQSSAVLGLVRGETTDSSTAQSLPTVPTSIPATWEQPSKLDELRGNQQSDVKVILVATKNLGKLLLQERLASVRADVETAATLTTRSKEHVASITRAVFRLDPTGKLGRAPADKQRKEVHRATRFCEGSAGRGRKMQRRPARTTVIFVARRQRRSTNIRTKRSWTEEVAVKGPSQWEGSGRARCRP